jgi:hypothetical protein
MNVSSLSLSLGEDTFYSGRRRSDASSGADPWRRPKDLRVMPGRSRPEQEIPRGAPDPVPGLRLMRRGYVGLALAITMSLGCQSGGGCDAAYPDLCIPPPPPDLDCDDVDGRRFEVRSPDPHGLDRDGDGTGCES